VKSKRVYKKELSHAELLDVVLDYLHRIGKVAEETEVIRLIEALSCHVVSAEWATLWMHDGERGRFRSETAVEGKRVEVDPKKGLLGRCYTEKQPFYVHLAEEDERFDAEVDNVENVPKKDMLFLPLFEKGDRVIAVLQVANARDDLQQFTHSDLAVLGVVGQFISRMVGMIRSGSLSQKAGAGTFDVEVNSTIEKLEQEKADAEAVAESSTKFLAQVAHEIRTPMNALMGFLELLKVDETDEQKLVYLETASKSGELMVALVNDLLDYAKIEKGMMELEEIEFEPQEEFASIGPLFAARMKKSYLKFEVFIDPNLPKTIVSDPHRIKQILSNLIGNAIKFTPENGLITLDILYDEEKHTIDFSVRDTGTGIAKDQQAKIFEAFRQEKSSTARQYGGTGLGLSISLQLARLFGSTLEVESEEGKGSRFYFSLPLKKEQLKDPGVFYEKDLVKKSRIGMLFSESFRRREALLQRYFESFGIAKSNQLVRKSWGVFDTQKYTHVFCSQDMLNKEAAQKLLQKGLPVIVVKNDAFKSFKEGLQGPVMEIPCPLDAKQLNKALMLGKDLINGLESGVVEHNKRILIVDDNSINIQFMQAVSNRLGVDTESASDGTNAVEIYKNAMEAGNPFDLVFMDENMPTMNGTEATEKIRRIEQEKGYGHTVIVGLSGNATEEQRSSSIEVGMDDCIFKPVSIKQITEVFDRYLKQA